MCLDNYQKVDFVLEKSSKRRKEILLNQLNSRGKTLKFVNEEHVNNFAEPVEKNEKVRFNYTYNELLSIARKHGLDKDHSSFLRFMIQAIQFCGIRIGDKKALEYVKPIHGFDDGFRYLRIAGVIETIRFTARVTPDNWRGEFSTNFVLCGSTIKIENVIIGELSSIFTASSLYNLSYITNNQNSERVLSINPLQKCGQHCKFCFKGSRAMRPDFVGTLINLSADEMIRYIQCEYSHQDLQDLTELVILTARFGNTAQLLKYVSDIYNGIKTITESNFDPVRNEQQRMKISTHLLDTGDSMREAARYGIKRYIYPIEIFDNELRRKYMSSSNYNCGNNKGDVTIENVYSTLNTAVEIFGSNNIEPVVIVGIDNYETCKQNLELLSKLNLRILTYNVFRVYDSDQIPMYQLSFDEIIELEQYIKNNFENNFSQRITADLPEYKEKYQEV